MSMDVTTEEKIDLVSDWTDSDGIIIRVIIRDSKVSEIGMTVTDPMRSKRVEFLLPHDHTLNSLRGLRNQLAEILIRLEQEMGIAHNASMG